MPSPRHLLVLAALTATCAAGVADASADVDRKRFTHVYSATIETKVDYNRAASGTNHLGTWSSQFDDEFTVRTEIPRVLITAGLPSYDNAAYSTAQAQRGHLVMIPAGAGHPVTCTGTDTEGLAGGALMGVMSTEVMQFKVRVLDGVTRYLRQCSGGLQQFVYRYDALGAPMGESYFDATVSFPGARLGTDHAQSLHGEVSGERCPGFDETTAVCVLSWDATITFHHVRSEPLTGTVPPMTPDELPTPGVPTPPAPRPVPRSKAFDAVGRAKLDLARGTATIPVTCSAACSGVASATVPGGRARAAAGVRPIATARFRAAAGRTATVVLRIPRRHRAAVRRAGALKVMLAVTPNGGRPARRTLLLKARRAR